MRRLTLFILCLFASPLFAQTDPLGASFKPTIDTNPGDYPSYIWVTDSLQKVRQDSGSPTTTHWGTFFGTQNEFIDFQVHVQAQSGGLANLNVVVSDFVQSSPGSFTISAASTNVQVYRAAYMNVTQKTSTAATYYNATGKYPDALIPAVDPYHGQTTNAFPFTVTAGNNQSVWVDVHVPSNAPSGYYLGSVTVKTGSTTLTTLPIILAVWQWPSASFMPSTSSLHYQTRIYYGDFCKQVYGATSGCSAYPGAGGNSDTGVTLTQIDLGRNLLDHRIGSANYSQPGYTTNFSGYETNYGPLANGTIGNTILSGAKLTAVEYYNGAGNFSNVNNWATEFNTKGWFPTLIAPTVDEPTTSGDWSNVISDGALVHGSTPPIPAAVTTNLAAATSNSALNAIDIFIPKINDLDPLSGSSLRSSYNTWLGGSAGPTRQIWEYQSCSSAGTCSNGTTGPSTATWPNYNVDGQAVANRVFGWLHWKNAVTGELYYAVADCFNDPVCTGNAPWTSVYAYGGWGDGTLFYPGDSSHVGTVTTPIWVQTVRLKQIRDGLQDYEYLLRMTNAGQGTLVTNQIATWITNSHNFSVTPANLQSARQTIGAAMHALTFTGGGGGPTTDIYITPTGSAVGVCTTNPQPRTFFNTAANWGTGSGQIGPGVTVHLCGDFVGAAGQNDFFTVLGDGTSTAPITIKFESGAIVEAPYFTNANHDGGAFAGGGHKFITIDGGGVGVVKNTANGTAFANKQPSDLIANFGNNFTLKGLTAGPVYVHTSGDFSGSDTLAVRTVGASNVTIGPGNTFTQCDVCVFYAWNGGETNFRITGNIFTNANQYIEMGPSNTGTRAIAGVIVDHNTGGGWANWDDGTAPGGQSTFHHNFFHPFTFGTGSAMNGPLQLYDNNFAGDMGKFATSMVFIEFGNNGSGDHMDPWYIVNNVFHRQSDNQLTSTGIVAPWSANGFLLNNTIVDDGRSTGSNCYNSLNYGFNSAGWTSKNNIFSGGCTFIYDQSQTTGFNNNVYFNSPQSTPFVWGASSFQNFTGWKGVCTGCDTASSTADPVLNTLLQPGAGSSATTLGANLTSLGISIVNVDINGNARPATGSWTAGAFNATSTSPAVTITPSPVAFGNQAVGTTGSATTITIANPGSATLTFNSPFFTITGTNPGDFARTGGTCTNAGNVAPAGNCTIIVTFTPAAAGGRSAVLNISGNASGTANLTGTGTAPAVTITPSPIAFANQTKGTTSAAKTVTISNPGSAPLVLSTPFFTIAGTNASDFARAGGTCANAGTVAAAGSCTITVTFTPATVGAESATLNIVGNASGSANITGAGVGNPGVTITPSPVPFGSWTQNTTSSPVTVTVTNSGTTNLILNPTYFSISGTNAGDFVNTNTGTCANNGTVAASASCTVILTFHPLTTAAETATLQIAGNASGTVTLNGTGTAPTAPAITITPSPQPFGNQNVGTTSGAATITVKNSGSAPLNLNTPFQSITGTNLTNFAVTGGTCANGGTVAAAATCTVTVTFTPSAAGARSAILNIFGNANGSVNLTGTGVATAPILTITPRPVTFPNTQQGSSSAVVTATLTNSGTANATLNTPYFTITGGAHPTDFVNTGAGSCANAAVIAPAGTCTITLIFTPATSAAETATLTVNAGAVSNANTLNGTGVAPGPGPAPAPLFASITVPPSSFCQKVIFWSTCTSTTATVAGTNFVDGVASLGLSGVWWSTAALSLGVTGTGFVPGTTAIYLDGVKLPTTCTAALCTAPTQSAAVTLLGSKPHSITVK